MCCHRRPDNGRQRLHKNVTNPTLREGVFRAGSKPIIFWRKVASSTDWAIVPRAEQTDTKYNIMEVSRRKFRLHGHNWAIIEQRKRKREPVNDPGYGVSEWVRFVTNHNHNLWRKSQNHISLKQYYTALDLISVLASHGYRTSNCSNKISNQNQVRMILTFFPPNQCHSN